MKVSIVIPAHNEENSISRTLEAVCAQEYPDFEVIVVDNASTDNTSEIAKKFPVKVVKEYRKGILFAREAGRSVATGEIIANVDADCLPNKKWLSKNIPHFSNNNIVAVSGPYDYFDGSKFFRFTSLFLQKTLYVFMNNILNYTHKGGVLIGGNNMIRASVLKEAGGYDTSLAFYGEDTNTAKKVSKYGKILFHPYCVMKTSARRFKKEGFLNITIKYFYHFFKQTIK
jgi:glycosyltransferase involved in cell wall biosynthesis